MYAEFFADAYGFLELFIILEGKGYDDLVELMLGKDVFEVTECSENLDPVVHRAGRNMLIEHADDIIAPLGILPYAVHIVFRSPGVSDEEHMLDIVSFFPEGLEDCPEDGSVETVEDDVEKTEGTQNTTGVVDVTGDVVHKEHQRKQADDIGFDQVEKLPLLPSGPSGGIDVAEAVYEDISGNDKGKDLIVIFDPKVIDPLGGSDKEI